MIFAQLAGQTGAALVNGALRNDESADAFTRAMRSLLGQVSVNNWGAHNFILCFFLFWLFGENHISFRRLRMGFDKPKPFIYATRNLGEQVRRISIIQLIRFTDRVAGLAPKRG